MNRGRILVWAIVAVIAVVVLSDVFNNEEKKVVCFEEKCFDAGIAITKAEREKGLMYAQEMPADEGMLFVFEDNDIHPFWMKNMRFPLDVLWMDGNGTIVYLRRNAAPCKEELSCKDIVPEEKSAYVLEINAGQAENLSVGDRMTIRTNDGAT